MTNGRWQRFRPRPHPRPRCAPRGTEGPFQPTPTFGPTAGHGAGDAVPPWGVPLEPGGAVLAKKGGDGGGGDRTPGWHCHCPHRVTSWCGAGEGTGAQRGPQPGLCHHPSSKPPCPQNHPLSSKPPCPQRHCLSPKPPCPQRHHVPKATTCPQSHHLSPKPSPVPKATTCPQSHHVPIATMSPKPPPVPPKPPPRGHRAPKATSHPRVPTCPGATTCPQSCARGRW